MAKVSKHQMRLDERKIIAELQNNGNQSIDTIAKNCGFSRQKVWRVIKRLEDDKAIWGYPAVVDTEKLQVKRYVLLIKKSNKPASNFINVIISNELQKRVKSLGVRVEYSGYLNGSFDWMIMFTAEDIRHAKRFVDTFHLLYSDSVSEVVLLDEIFPVKVLGFPNPNVERLKDFV